MNEGATIMPAKCPQCGAQLPAGALDGLCPACLLQQGATVETATRVGAVPFQPPSVEEIARLFPQLEILSLIGKGGMGAVYKARQPQLDRWVALKILPPNIAGGPGFPERFNREARALAKLNHPNIVTVHEFGQVNGLPFFIMEFVDGLNLRQLERAGKLSPREALQIVPQICEALQFAHDEGVVHRDIKPENILLDKRGRVKIADFGIAKIVGGGDALPRVQADQQVGPTHITEADKVVGTPHYMAPEQVEKPQEVDHRADIYSLGVVFYEMLTGELPLGKFQPPSSKVLIDVRLDEVVMRALEKEPERRYQQASEVKTQVETIAATGSAGVPPAGSGVAPDSSSNKRVNEPSGAAPRVPWGMWSPLHSSEMREICAHLTKEERNQASLISVICGVAFVAVMIGGIQTLMVSTPGPGIWIVVSVLVILFIVCFPIGARMLRQLLCSTAWARQRGYKPEQFRIFYFRGNNLWKGLGVLLVGLLLVFGQSKLFTQLSGVSKLTASLKEDAAQTKRLHAQLEQNDSRLKSAVGDAEKKVPVAEGTAAEAGQTLDALPPVVVETHPISGANDVEPGITEVRARFSKGMQDQSWSWSTAWLDSTPESVESPSYDPDHRTCVMKVRLEPGKTYAWWLNSGKFHNFTDPAGHPAIPYLLIFQTKPN